MLIRGTFHAEYHHLQLQLALSSKLKYIWSSVLCFQQIKVYLIAAIVIMHSQYSLYAALAASCQVYPSEYAYHDDSVPELRVPAPTVGGIHLVTFKQVSIQNITSTVMEHVQLKLIDSNFGQEQYQNSDYYEWNTGSADQLLFIFPTRVSLTTITLHYYSDSVPETDNNSEKLTTSCKYPHTVLYCKI